MFLLIKASFYLTGEVDFGNMIDELGTEINRLNARWHINSTDITGITCTGFTRLLFWDLQFLPSNGITKIQSQQPHPILILKQILQ